MATYSHARDAPNASPLSAPPLPLVTIHEAIRTPATDARYAQNSVVLSACFVSVESRDGPETRMSDLPRVTDSEGAARGPPRTTRRRPTGDASEHHVCPL